MGFRRGERYNLILKNLLDYSETDWFCIYRKRDQAEMRVSDDAQSESEGTDFHRWFSPFWTFIYDYLYAQLVHFHTLYFHPRRLDLDLNHKSSLAIHLLIICSASTGLSYGT